MIRIHTPISNWYMKICQKVYLFLKPLLHFPGHLQFVGKHPLHLLSPFKKGDLIKCSILLFPFNFMCNSNCNRPSCQSACCRWCTGLPIKMGNRGRKILSNSRHLAKCRWLLCGTKGAKSGGEVLASQTLHKIPFNAKQPHVSAAAPHLHRKKKTRIISHILTWKSI